MKEELFSKIIAGIDEKYVMEFIPEQIEDDYNPESFEEEKDFSKKRIADIILPYVALAAAFAVIFIVVSGIRSEFVKERKAETEKSHVMRLADFAVDLNGYGREENLQENEKAFKTAVLQALYQYLNNYEPFRLDSTNRSISFHSQMRASDCVLFEVDIKEIEYREYEVVDYREVNNFTWSEEKETVTIVFDDIDEEKESEGLRCFVVNLKNANGEGGNQYLFLTEG